MNKFRKFELSSGTKIFLGRDAKSNDELVKQFKGSENIILHTTEPGSGFCVIAKTKPLQKEIKEAAVFCARHSRDWRDNKGDVKVDVFTGKDVSKSIFMKTGMWKVKNKKKRIKIKKQDIKKCLR